jgi:hypothetical protein
LRAAGRANPSRRFLLYKENNVSREAEQKVLGSIAEYIETLVKRIEHLESKLDSSESDEGFNEKVANIVNAQLDQYDPTQYSGFNDAVDDRCSSTVPEIIGDMEFSATITASRRGRRY